MYLDAVTEKLLESEVLSGGDGDLQLLKGLLDLSLEDRFGFGDNPVDALDRSGLNEKN